MKEIFKKNQIVIIVIVCMLITAGYFSYDQDQTDTNLGALADAEEQIGAIGDAKLVSANVLENAIVEEKVDVNTEVDKKEGDTQTNKNENEISSDINTNAVFTSTSETNETNNTQKNTQSEEISNYYTSSKLERDKMYSQMLETYTKILENDAIPSDQKSIAQTEIKSINDKKNALMICENLIKTKGFEDVLILINQSSVNVVIKKEKLEVNEIAQIQNIVSRELNIQIEEIHIATK